MTKNFVVLDFETRSLVDLTVMGAYKYCKHPKTEPIILTYSVNGRDVKYAVKKNIKKTCLMLYEKYFSKGYTFVAHNVYFDYFLFTSITKKYPKKLVCTALLSCVAGGPKSLNDSAIFFKSPVKKDVQGKALISVLSIPAKKVKRSHLFGVKLDRSGLYVENKKLFKLFLEYAVRDTEACLYLYEKLNKFQKHIEEHKIDKNYKINAIRSKRGLLFDIDLVKKSIHVLAKFKKRLDKKVVELTKNENFNLNSSKQVLEFLNSFELAEFENTQTAYLKRFYDLYKKRLKKEFKPLLDFIKLKLDYPKSTTAKFNAIVEKTYKGLSYDNFTSFDTITGRFKGVGINILNFKRSVGEEKVKENIKNLKKGVFLKKEKGEACRQLEGSIRAFIKARPNKVFLGGDFSQIELRLLLLASGHRSEVEKLYKGFDYYVEYGKKAFKKKEITDAERYIAKRAVLSLGYGMGHKALKGTFLNEGIDISTEFSEELVKTYRSLFYKVREYQYNLLSLFPNIVVPFTNRKLFYGYPEYKKVWNKFKESYEMTWTYKANTGAEIAITPGMLAGHAIQSLARDVFCYKERELYKKGYNLVIPFHDEFVAEEDVNFSLKTWEKDFKSSPPFLKKLGFEYLDCSVWKGLRYYK